MSRKTHNTLCVFGPTGVGKTRLLFTCFKNGFEVINADSMQVYRGLDIGSAKPSQEILNEVPHHLIDIMEPQEQFTLGDFVRRTGTLIEEIRQRSAVPVISGGTAFYFKHLISGLPSAPESTAEVREHIERLAEQKGIEYLYELLRGVDEISSQRIHQHDAYRIKRALEVYHSSGKPLSSFTDGQPPVVRQPLLIGLQRDREELYERIDLRVEQMFDEGLVDEIRRLMKEGAEESWPGMKGIGYREFFIARAAGEYSDRGILEMIQHSSRVYAKRQITFFSSLPGVHWFHPDDLEGISSFIEKRLY